MKLFFSLLGILLLTSTICFGDTAPLFGSGNVLVGANFNDGPGSSDMTLIIRLSGDGEVYVDEGRAISVKDALVGINQLIDEDADKGKEVPPVTAEPMTRQFLRTFDGKTEIARDQLQKFLRGSITTPDEFVQRGWCSEKNKVFTLVDPLDFARDWQGRHKRKLTSDLDQALVLIGA